MRGLFRGLVVLIGIFLPYVCEPQESCVTANCHVSLLEGKTIHAATESCDTCHESIATPHPKKGQKTFKLTQNSPELCANCHDPVATKPNVHSPVKDGECTACHEPHSSDQPKLLVQPLKEICLMCHSDKTEFAVVHGPTSAGDCVACHQPHESERKALLTNDESELCFTCHSDMQKTMEKNTVHPPVMESCTSCHNPHGSTHKKLLSAEGKDLCLQCHSDLSDLLSKAKLTHPPVESDRACASCHSPHSSDYPTLLLKASKELCLDCHKDVIQKNMTTVHAPIQEGQCAACHNPHGSQHPKLLNKQFPATTYVAYKKTEYELCFSCHNRDLLAYPDTSFATNFRDGERNLHYIHVNKTEKGRSCTLCHEVHGSANTRLIAEKVPFGKWTLPIKFVQAKDGGSCSPGCHKPESYNRSNIKSPTR